jgi:hypothetical protein
MLPFPEQLCHTWPAVTAPGQSPFLPRPDSPPPCRPPRLRQLVRPNTAFIGWKGDLLALPCSGTSGPGTCRCFGALIPLAASPGLSQHLPAWSRLPWNAKQPQVPPGLHMILA